MTTIIAYQNQICADRRVKIKPYGGTFYYTDENSKIIVTECKRIAVVFFFKQPDPSVMQAIVDDMLRAMVAMEAESTYPQAYLRKSTIEAIPEDTQTYIATKKGVFFLDKLHVVFELKENKVKKPNELINVVFAKMPPEHFSVGGSGADYAIGFHFADKKMPIKEIAKRVSEVDGNTSPESDLIKCSSLKTLLPRITKKKGGKNVKRKRR